MFQTSRQLRVAMASPSTEDTWLPASSLQQQQASETDNNQQIPGNNSLLDTTNPATLYPPPPPDETTAGSIITGNNMHANSDELVTIPVISLRMIMTSKDVGSIIGKAGMTIKAFREQSGAKINISNGTSSERLVTITGTKSSISSAFTAITSKIQQDNLALAMVPPSKPPGEVVPNEMCTDEANQTGSISLRLIIQTSQCGSLIGKGGAKIKDIRETTNALIQVAGESLPNSTERTVTVSGQPEAVTKCVEEICDIMIESPPKGPFMPYKPHPPSVQPAQLSFQPRPNLPFQSPYTATFNTASQPSTTTQHMRIPNDLIGCVIGRKGTKIHEIRVSSGAMIKIAGNEGDGSDRLVTITGSPESVGLAQYLINSRIHSEVNNFLLGSV